MFNINLAELLKTYSPEDIANNFAEQLNKAIKAKEEEEKENIKNKEFENIISLLNNWLKTYYPSIASEETTDQMIDAMMDFFDTTESMIRMGF